jgi:hypothetical protein
VQESEIETILEEDDDQEESKLRAIVRSPK